MKTNYLLKKCYFRLENNKKIRVIYLTLGLPEIDYTYDLIKEINDKNLCDVIELGIPFSDPIADGVVIQQANKIALSNNITILDGFSLIKKLRKNNIKIPILIMTYFNIIYNFGLKKCVEFIYKSKGDGFIIPDVLPEYNKEFSKYCNEKKIALVNIISPNTNLERIKEIIKQTTGFIYYVPYYGITGSDSKIENYSKILHILKKITNLPVLVGFGIKTNENVKKYNKTFDGTIVGSAIIKKILAKNKKSSIIKFLQNLFRSD